MDPDTDSRTNSEGRRRRRVDALFEAALSAADREGFLATCGELRKDVEALLAAHARVDPGFLATSAAERLGGVEETPGTRVGRYTIVRRIARGAAGVVYEAEQDQPRRSVALKIMRFGSERFAREAEILARLDHPDIATVHEAGLHEGRLWVAMELVAGARTLGEWAADRTLRERLEHFVRICDAVHHGHLRGVIHRDLKPANLLVRESGPKVVDFGIAAMEGSANEEIAGTLPYMAPEQCERGAPPDPRSDVYALGVVLHELVSGDLPFDLPGVRISDAKEAILDASPARLPGDIGAIAAKAMAKSPADRYPSAAALAEEIRRFLQHRPVRARPASAFRQLHLFVRRRTALALTLAALVLVLVTGATVSIGFALLAEGKRRDAELRACVANLAVAQRALGDQDVAEARRRLADVPEELRGWEWRHLSTVLDMSEGVLQWPGASIVAGAVQPDGRIGAATAGNAVRVWDLATGEVLADWSYPDYVCVSLAFEPEGRRLALGMKDGTTEIRSIRDGRVLSTLTGHASVVNRILFTLGRVVTASRDGTVRIWNPDDGAELAVLRGHPDRVVSLAATPDGKIISGGREGVIRIWEDDRTVDILTGHTGSVEGLALSPAGDRLASVSRDRTLRIWDLHTLRPVVVRTGHRENVRDVAWGSVIATASYDRTVGLWDPDDGHLLGRLRGHENLVRSVGVRDGRVVSFGAGGTIRSWAPRPLGEALGTSRTEAAVLQARFSGDRLLGASADGTVRWWDPKTGAETGCVSVGASVTRVAGSPEAFLATTNQLAIFRWADGHLTRLPTRIYYGNAARDEQERRWYHGRDGLWLLPDGTTSGYGKRVDDSEVDALAFSAGGDRVATASGPVVRTWDRGTLAGPRAEIRLDSDVSVLAVSPDGDRIGAGLVDGAILILRTRDLEILGRASGHSDPVRALAFHPDGTRLASGSNDLTVRLWSLPDPMQMAAFTIDAHVRSLAFSEDGVRLAAGVERLDSSGQVLVWSTVRR